MIAGPSWSITTIGNVDCETIRTQCLDVSSNTTWSGVVVTLILEQCL